MWFLVCIVLYVHGMYTSRYNVLPSVWFSGTVKWNEDMGIFVTS